MVRITNNVMLANLLTYVIVTDGLFSAMVISNPFNVVSSMCGWSRGPGGLAWGISAIVLEWLGGW